MLRLCFHSFAAAAVLGLAACATPSAPPAGFTHHGNFKQMSHSGDTQGRVKLADLRLAPGTWGVGATAGLKGEILVVDGRMLVSPGSDARGQVRAPAAGEEAVLYAGAQVAGWTAVPVPRELDQAGLEAFIVEQARARGVDVAQPFAFLVEGRFPRLRWHVVTGEKPADAQGGGHGGGHANAASGLRVFHDPGASGLLVGIYSGAALEGVVSHPGERFHLHYADAGLRVSGHVDAYAVGAGATLKLPQR